EAEEPAAPEPEPVPEPATQAAADASMAAASEGVGEIAPSNQQPVAPAQAAAAASENGKAFVSPVVARIASEHGVDPGQVHGTGRGGRVTKQDILAFIAGGGQAAAHAAPAAPPPPSAPVAAPVATPSPAAT